MCEGGWWVGAAVVAVAEGCMVVGWGWRGFVVRIRDADWSIVNVRHIDIW